ncbi:hypothetical protein IPZ58_35690 [Streptomyces roseoverticillatus]|uniref:hypothetical protein n=1 Tax=Streptomyces roseoverticillatus TaxID=66429 RepID=UPI001F2879F2|nr:hypothetical protein [Streptomyces roseoverticillatus]MCF3106868.1 hypothetical protein [Streptomyces roseoverticillatus]
MSNVPRWAVLAAACAAVVAAVGGCSSDSSKSDDAKKQASSKPSGGASSGGAPSGGAPSGTPSGKPPSGSPVPASGSIPAGPGPQPSYTVQKQPADGSCHYRFTPAKEPLPDPACTPGATNPKVTQATLKTTICRSGYTAGIRPPTNITGREKTANAASYGYKGSLREAEYDHLISLQLGGDPNDPRNLWVQPPSPGHQEGKGPNNPKDAVETKLKNAICSGKTDLVKAQQAIARDWTTALDAVGVTDKGAKGETAGDPDDNG